MATLYITEFNRTSIYFANAPTTPPVAEQAIAITGASAASAAFDATTYGVMLVADVDCSLAFGATPTAVATAHYVPAKTTRFYGVVPGQKVAVISNP